MLSHRAGRKLMWASLSVMLPVAVFAGFTGHPWIAAGFAAGILAQIAHLVRESHSK